ncbi:MAG: hypothetical protein ABH849_01865 [Nanoarchaeota archaeon]
MNKILIFIVLFVLVFSMIFVTTACTVKTEKEDGLFSTKKTTTSVTGRGIVKETKNCPFWDRDC